MTDDEKIEALQTALRVYRENHETLGPMLKAQERGAWLVAETYRMMFDATREALGALARTNAKESWE